MKLPLITAAAATLAIGHSAQQVLSAAAAGKYSSLASTSLDEKLYAAGQAFQPYQNPPELSSGDTGKLHVKLEVNAARFSAAGVSYNTRLYNGIAPGPTLRIRAGDKLSINLINKLEPDGPMVWMGALVCKCAYAVHSCVGVSAYVLAATTCDVFYV